jgi:predicted GNAT superfamily acetyltransferase
MADFTIRDLRSAGDLAACVALQEEVWGYGFSERVPAALLRVAVRVGAVLAGAFDGSGRLLGHVFGLTGVRDGQVIHWSDMLAVHPAARDRGIGEALKRYQRDTLLARGVTRAEWTFDPLESRNAHLNFARFGGIAREYIRDFYATSDSPLHSGLATDRLIVTWEMDSRRVQQRLDGAATLPSPESITGALLVNPVREEGRFVTCDEPRLNVTSPRALIAVPPNIQTIKSESAGLAIHWREMTRAAFEHYLERGYYVMEFVRGDRYGAYLLDEAAGR